MGGPNSLFEVESFLKNMFNDPLILGIKNNFARSMLAKFITSRRLEESKANYQAIGGKSPLSAHTFALTERLNELGEDLGNELGEKSYYTYAMRYTPPFAIDVLRDLKDKGFSSICLFSLYPQFSYSTTYSSFLDVQEALKKLDYTPSLSYVEHYPTHEGYIACIIKRIKEALGDDGAEDFTLLLSAHSLPQSRIDSGDPYQKQCEANAKALESALAREGLHFKHIKLCYQSKVGRMKWIGPSASEMIKAHRQDKLLIFPLSFSIDNSETDFELSLLYAKLAKSLNVPAYRVCKCFNAMGDFARTITQLVKISTPTQEFYDV